VQVVYNIFDQSPAQKLFAACQKHNVGVIARVPLDEGSLTGKFTESTRFPDGDSKKKYVTEQAYAAFNINPKLGGTNATNVILALKTAIDAVKALINALKALRGGVR
jgi:aryl-alcohol dehydrogenase-like predicted oxidoreductase